MDFSTGLTTGIIDFSESELEFNRNVYIDLDGTIKPHKFPKPGLWKYDGQFYYLPKPVV